LGANDTDTILELDGVTKRYRQTTAVDALSLRVRRGSFFGLLGPSGCGKTTTLRLIGGFEEPDAGDIRLSGKSVTALKPFQRKVNTVFQSYALFPHLTVRGNVEFGLRHLPKQETRRRTEEVFTIMQLHGKENRFPSQLSGGEKQRVALARSLVMQPEVLLLDEPLSALDARLRNEVRQQLLELQRQLGITFLLVTHDQEEAMSLCDEIAILNQGRLVQIGSPREIYLAPTSRFAASFLGKVNWVNGFGVRPEAVRVATEAPPPGMRAMGATVRHQMFLGNCLQIEAALPCGLAILAETSRFQRPFREGEAITVWWHPEDEMQLGDSNRVAPTPEPEP
jgi:ABC-type Fe3+/spermidine/putrescine transport system ATPase subunit